MSNPYETPVIDGLSKRRRRRRPVLKIAATVAAAAVVLASAGGWYAVNHYADNIQRVDALPAQSTAVPAVGGAQNILVSGSDTREGLTKAQRTALSTGR